MKKRMKLFLLLFFVIFLGYAISVHADSGWDGSYDSGGSSWDSGSSWSSGFDSGSSGGYYGSYGSSGSVSGDDWIIFLIIIIVIVFLTVSMKSKSGEKKVENKYSIVSYDIEKIRKLLPSFDKVEFQNQVYEIYKHIQTAWMNFDYDTLRKYTTDELYNLYHSQLIALNVKKQKNVMKEFELTDFEIVDMEYNNDMISLKVRMLVECLDYVVDQNNKVVRGNANRKLVYDYEMTFIKGFGTKDNKCPNCNAPLDNNQSTVCPYCDSIIISDNHDWVLSKKQMINQKWK